MNNKPLSSFLESHVDSLQVSRRVRLRPANRLEEGKLSSSLISSSPVTSRKQILGKTLRRIFLKSVFFFKMTGELDVKEKDEYPFRTSQKLSSTNSLVEAKASGNVCEKNVSHFSACCLSSNLFFAPFDCFGRKPHLML